MHQPMQSRSINHLFSEPMIVCVGPRTHYTLSGLKQGQMYYFNLYAINRQSNLTYPYGAAHTVFSSKLKPISLKDGKPAFTNLKKYDGKAVFRYKVSGYSNHLP